LPVVASETTKGVDRGIGSVIDVLFHEIKVRKILVVGIGYYSINGSGMAVDGIIGINAKRVLNNGHDTYTIEQRICSMPKVVIPIGLGIMNGRILLFPISWEATEVKASATCRMGVDG
jgi:hypothetical protein